ncbi:MAG: hypothetical protein N2039_03270, partial [Gemmataceae bacterium]|nr:hypothetical protein [Gemmataceae bacterium]
LGGNCDGSSLVDFGGSVAGGGAAAVEGGVATLKTAWQRLHLNALSVMPGGIWTFTPHLGQLTIVSASRRSLAVWCVRRDFCVARALYPA